jgi:phage shock protein PspC (stress-responsive transcriptional regulator)
MKVTVNISLAGSAFHVDEDACQCLQQYLALLEKEFCAEAGSAEILADIESRVAELFKMRLGKYKQVITMKDLEEVTAILGSPQAISGKETFSRQPPFTPSRRFYRDHDRRFIAGVCSGIAAYFSWDPLLFRLLFVALVFAGGFGFALYLVLWIVLPEAKTTAQKLEMRGAPVTIANIKEIAKQEFETVKKKMNL